MTDVDKPQMTSPERRLLQEWLNSGNPYVAGLHARTHDLLSQPESNSELNAAGHPESTGADASAQVRPAPAAPSEAPTPRTDALDKDSPHCPGEWVALARQLERDLSAALEREHLANMRADQAEEAMASMSERIVELSHVADRPTAQSATAPLSDDLMRKIRTLVEDFGNPCFGCAIHNEIPRTLGLVVLQHFAAPEGWVAVPKEPTEAMQDALINTLSDECGCDPVESYRAMLAAAPKGGEHAREVERTAKP